MMNIPYQNMEIEQIYTQVLSEPGRSIAICSADSGEGVTSIALALAQRNLLAGHSTLLVDLNLYRPAVKSLLNIDTLPLKNAVTTQNTAQATTPVTASVTALLPTSITAPITVPPNIKTRLISSPQLITTDKNAVVLTGITAPNRRESIMKLRQPGVLEQCIRDWMQEYDTVIIDTSPINRINANNIPPERVAAACHGAVLVVLAGHTNEAMVTTAVNKLHVAKAQLLGCVFNDRDNPSLKNELIREVERLGPRFSWIISRCKNFLHHNRLLKLEI